MTTHNVDKGTCSKSCRMKNEKNENVESSKKAKCDLKHQYLMEDNNSPAFFPGY